MMEEVGFQSRLIGAPRNEPKGRQMSAVESTQKPPPSAPSISAENRAAHPFFTFVRAAFVQKAPDLIPGLFLLPIIIIVAPLPGLENFGVRFHGVI